MPKRANQKETKYTKALIELLELVEKNDTLSVDLWNYTGKPTWKVTKREKMDDREVRITYEGDNLEVVLKKVLY